MKESVFSELRGKYLKSGILNTERFLYRLIIMNRMDLPMLRSNSGRKNPCFLCLMRKKLLDLKVRAGVERKICITWTSRAP